MLYKFIKIRPVVSRVFNIGLIHSVTIVKTNVNVILADLTDAIVPLPVFRVFNMGLIHSVIIVKTYECNTSRLYGCYSAIASDK